MFDLSFFLRTFLALWKAVPTTLLITAVSLAVGVVRGFLFALARYTKNKVLSHSCSVFL